MLSPIFHFATAHKRPSRRSPGDRSAEICTAPTGHASDLHASHESVNDTTCTARSDCSDHVCHLHSMVIYDESLLLEPGFLWHSTAHRTDAPKHTCHGSFSMRVHNAAWYSYLYRTSHTDCCGLPHAPHSTSCLQGSAFRSSDICTAPYSYKASLSPPCITKALKDCSLKASFHFAFRIITIS